MNDSGAKVDGETGSTLVSADRRSLVRSANLLITLVVAVLSAFKWMAVGTVDPPVPGMLLVMLGVGNTIYLAMGGSSLIAARFLIGMLTVGLIFAGFNTGGFGGPIVLLSPILPILSFLLISARAGWIAAGVMLLCLFVLLLVHLGGLMPPSPHAESSLVVGRFITVAVTGLLCTWVIWTFASTANALALRNELLANTDHLTGIANRRAVEAYLDREILRARRNSTSLSLVLSDVDFFKRYNDVNGHAAGDKCLVRVAEVLQRCGRRPSDMVGRFGGEEFVAILPETDAGGAAKIAERMRQALLKESLPYEPGGPDMVSMTFGVTASLGQEISSASSLLKLADDALYQGKEEGRNRVVINLP